MTREERKLFKAKYDGKCAICGCDFGDDFKLILKVYKPSNINDVEPACGKCKAKVSRSGTIEKYRARIEDYPHDIAVSQMGDKFKEAKLRGLITVHKIPVVFYFETLKTL